MENLGIYIHIPFCIAKCPYCDFYSVTFQEQTADDYCKQMIRALSNAPGQGRKVDFKNTVIIMTSNAGARSIAAPKRLGFTSVETPEQSYEMMKKGVMDEIKNIFKPEFLNRIDDIIVFHQLNNENMKEIVNLLASNLYKRCEDQLGIHLTITAALKEHLVSKYADNKMGARPLKRAIQSVVEDALAEEILQKKVVPGDKVSAGFKDGKVVFTVKN